MSSIEELNQLLVEKKPLVAMLAPSFPIEFDYPAIINQLRSLGFDKVVEVAAGAAKTSQQLLELVEKNPNQRFITSPCPSIVRLIKNSYPHLVKYLTAVDSPMIQTAKIVKQKFPNHRPVFIGPCPVKKLEAEEDYPELNLLVLTYREIKPLLAEKKVGLDLPTASFDLAYPATRLYPISGGLAQTTALNSLLTDDEYDVVSGLPLVQKVLGEFEKSRLRVLDILFCQEGCIMGKGIDSQLTIKQRREKIISHWGSGEIK
jgi:hypothetical protein